ncbi:hypothetical protein RFM99_29195 [Mesorhizobium sp. VK4C]|uniref:hypothetical protein n=1 Tax=Mesorhizobium captivum TaxID=3072319 RepID=UPI002A245520|nr:hypothetical protein [Mesorhizobium sp. VK4C]MDX8502463.1 hypothetical protein [Mesorhizobium sp. VK4C]
MKQRFQRGPAPYMLSAKAWEKGVSRERDVRMWREAEKLAVSGDYEGWLAIEWELRSRGFPRAKLLFDNDRVRQKFDDICKTAQANRTERPEAPRRRHPPQGRAPEGRNYLAGQQRDAGYNFFLPLRWLKDLL